jgi:GNAT superfamily N-acetyltransferase
VPLPENERLEVQRRPLTSDEADQVMAEVRLSGAITGYSDAEWRGKRDVFVLVGCETNELVATVLVHHMWGGWSEIAVVFVLERHRGRGYGTTLLQAVMRTLRSDGRKKLIFFLDDKMAHLAEVSGFDLFDSVDSYLCRWPRDKLFFKVAYKIQWLTNIYRLRELQRKRRQLGSTYEFKFGVCRA